MKKCIDCGVELSVENKSRHQPSIRCLQCFSYFADDVSLVLSGEENDTRELGKRRREAADHRF